MLACYNAIIPHLAPELPAAQKTALAQCVKRPMVVVNTVLRNGKALRKLGIKGAQLPGSFLQNVSWCRRECGDYRPAWKPGSLRHAMVREFRSVASRRGLASSGAARAQLLAMTFEDYEREVRDELEPARIRRLRRWHATSSPSPSTAGRTAMPAPTSTSRTRRNMEPGL